MQNEIWADRFVDLDINTKISIQSRYVDLSQFKNSDFGREHDIKNVKDLGDKGSDCDL